MVAAMRMRLMYQSAGSEDPAEHNRAGLKTRPTRGVLTTL